SEREPDGEQRPPPKIENRSVDVFNLFADHDWDDEQERDGYRHRVATIGPRLGGALLGGSLYELPPGESTWPYHYEHGSEEWLLVAAGGRRCGRPTASGSSRPATSPCSPRGRRVRTRSRTPPTRSHASSSSRRSRRSPSSRIPTAGRSASGRARTATSVSCATSRSSTTGTASDARL